MSGQVSSSGRCGLSRNSMSKSDLSSCTTKPQGSEQRKSMSPSARCPAKRMSLNATGCKACSRLGSKAEREKPQKHSHQRSANSSWTCTPKHLPCPGEKLPKFVTFSTVEGQIIKTSNILRPLRLRLPSRPGATSPGTRFLIRQSASWQPSDCIQKGGRSLLLPPTLRPHGIPSMTPSSAGPRKGSRA